ncbi:dATP/dGTP diphosphohydrolase domain-containing protein [Dyella kyungheensis]|uniref:dATP/dGTP diphosphohydrolase domain-containing protein n=1 Tax=Dyella kyungheensis TaxID=1242174 RepID=UPI003CF3052C
MANSLTGDAAARKASPMAEGLLWYFPNALAEVASVSKAGNDQHNPGKPLHHDRSKSADHADCILRHLVDAGTKDSDGVRHTAKVAWRALALLQEELEREEGAPLPRNARGSVHPQNEFAAYRFVEDDREGVVPIRRNPDGSLSIDLPPNCDGIYSGLVGN